MSMPRFIVVAVALVGGAVVSSAERVTSVIAQQPADPVVLQRAEPAAAAPARPGDDRLVVLEVTITPSGETTVGKVTMLTADAFGVHMAAGSSDAATYPEKLDRSPDLPGGVRASDLRAALEALRQWRFGPVEQPFHTVVGFNLARNDQSGVESEPIRLGGNIPAPRKTRDVPPDYPPDIQAAGVQGNVRLELTIDGAGIPVTAYAVRPVEGLTMQAVEAALRWRYERDANYSRRIMFAAVDFVLSRSAPSAIGVARGGAPPQPSAMAPVRVGGNIAPPTKTKHVDAVLPDQARQAGIQGVVILEIIIGLDGRVQDAKILRSIPQLDEAALDAVRQWEYTPTLVNETPVPVIMTVTVSFLR